MTPESSDWLLPRQGFGPAGLAALTVIVEQGHRSGTPTPAEAIAVRALPVLYCRSAKVASLLSARSVGDVSVFPSRPRWQAAAAAAAVALCLLLAGCGVPGPGAGNPTADASTRRPDPSAGTTTPTVGLVVANGPGWHGGAVDGPAPAPGACRYGAAAGMPLPDPACTPGALDAAVTQANLAQTLCRKGGYTASVRPPQQVTDAFKKLARSAYSSPGASPDYELDHLVPLGLGGASDAPNLWPQRNLGDPRQFDRRSSGGSNAKDGVESRLNRAVCAGEVPLAAAQAAIAADWYTAESVLGIQP